MRGALKNEIGISIGKGTICIRGHNSKKRFRDLGDDGCILEMITMLSKGEDPTAPHVFMSNDRGRKITAMKISEKGILELYIGLKELIKLKGLTIGEKS